MHWNTAFINNNFSVIIIHNLNLRKTSDHSSFYYSEIKSVDRSYSKETNRSLKQHAKMKWNTKTCWPMRWHCVLLFCFLWSTDSGSSLFWSLSVSLSVFRVLRIIRFFFVLNISKTVNISHISRSQNNPSKRLIYHVSPLRLLAHFDLKNNSIFFGNTIS